MRRLLFVAALLFSISLLDVAAQKLTEVVYLKNGSMIRGTVLELVPNGSLKIQTADGSVFVYTMQEVEKITKENLTAPNRSGQNSTYQPTRAERFSRFAPKRGYTGFVDLEIGGAVGDYGSNLEGVTTSHGCRIIPQLFVGGGTGILTDLGEEVLYIPVFADVRYTILKRNISPTVGMKVGYSFLDLKGVCFNPSVGCRFSLSHNFALNVSLSYHLQQAEAEWWYYDNGSDHFYYTHEILSYLGCSLGFEF